ncbi:MAG: ABC transporter permease [Treponema sp.]|jgi:simple sugar transport system permease protein|nr:ABC transporter permease [Treponema sp.]
MKKIRSVYAELLPGVLIPLGAALIIPLVFIAAGSRYPAGTLQAFFLGPWSNTWFLGNTLDSMALLFTASLGAVIAFRGGCFNLGCEGQIYMGGIAAAVLLLKADFLSGPISLVLAALGACLTGGIMGAVSGLLRKKTGAGELITSFLLAAALIPAGDYLIAHVLRSPGVNLLATDKFSPDRVLPHILPPSSLSVSIIISLALVFLFHFFIHRTAQGYRFRITGLAPDLALFGGIDSGSYVVPAMACSGALAGLAGFFAVAGTYGMCYQGFSGGLGWNGIAMALIAGNEPLILLPAVFIFSSIRAGADAAMLQPGFGFETAAFIQAAVLLLAALPFGIRYLKGKGL